MAENSRNYALRFRESCCSSSRRDGNFKTKFCRMEKVSSSSGVSLVGAARGKFVESLGGEGRAEAGGGDVAPHTSSEQRPSISTPDIGLNWQVLKQFMSQETKPTNLFRRV